MIIAQILNKKAHWIFETDIMPEYPPDPSGVPIVLIDITNLNPIPAEGWLYDESTDTFSPPPEPGPIEPQATLEEQIYAENLYQTALLEMQSLGGM